MEITIWNKDMGDKAKNVTRGLAERAIELYGEESQKTSIRLPALLKKTLEESAVQKGRTLTIEILLRLAESVERELDGPTVDIDIYKKTLLAVVKGTIAFPGDTPEEQVKNLATYLKIPSDDPDLQDLLKSNCKILHFPTNGT